MADFNPDEFLAEGEDTFDPDSFLAEPDSIVNEMHPKFDFADRLIVKNFGGDVDQSIGYLKKRHPDLDIKASLDGEILARAKGEEDYRKLDPSGFMNSITNPKELFQDITDVGSDIVAGLGTTAATAAGGLAGNIPGAVAAGTGSSAAIEALRQSIGKALGVGDFNAGDIALQGAFGAASPLLFGTGASAAGAAKTAAKQLGANASKEALEATTEGILKNQRGLAGIGYDAFRDKVAPKLGELTSGVSAHTIRTAREHLPEIDQMGKEGLKKTAGELREQVVSAWHTKQGELGEALESTIDNAEGLVDIEAAKGPLLKLKADLEKRLATTKNQATIDELSSVKAKLDYFFKTKAEPASQFGIVDEFGKPIMSEAASVPSQVTARDAFELKQQLKSLSEIAKTKEGGLLNRFGTGHSLGDKRLAFAADDAADILQQGIDDATGGATKEINAAYGAHQKLRKDLNAFFKTDKDAFKKLSNIRSPANRVEFEGLQEVDKTFGTKIIDTADKLTAFKQFTDAPWMAISSKGTTSTSRTLTNPLSVGLGGIGAYIGGKQDGGGYGGAIIGGGIGGGLGALLGGPKALRTYMQTQRNLSKMAEQGKALGFSPQAGALSFWQMMQDKDR